MASTILYKFQSGTTFEALPLPGSAARLFDVKKAIVQAKKLDNSGSMEFDLTIRNADTNEEYANEGMLLPRGTRLIVQRLPAPRGHGFLARMARNEQLDGPIGGQHHHHSAGAVGSAPSGYYTIDSRTRDDDEFVSSSGGGTGVGIGGPGDDEKELAALQAATNLTTSGPAMTGGYTGGASASRIAGSGQPRPGGMGGGGAKPSHYRPNADPELRDQEKQAMPKKRATGIPRTFLNLSAPPQTEGATEGDEQNVPLLQPNALGFKELVNRKGGQSGNTAGTRRDLDYALKLTSTTVPEHLQCGICNGVVKSAMLLPWDPEGRTVCELCIRDALTQNGFRCPLTGTDGVSPDDLIPNVGLRKAAELFVKGVMEKVDEIEQQQVEEAVVAEDTSKSAEANVLDGDGVEKGVLVSKKMTLTNRKKDSDDPFGGGDDDFGGDVFAVEIEKKDDTSPEVEEKEELMTKVEKPVVEKKENEKLPTKEVVEKPTNDVKESSVIEKSNKSGDDSGNTVHFSTDTPANNNNPKSPAKAAPPKPKNRRERRRRGPPVGYSTGPARSTGARAVVPPPIDVHGRGPPRDDRSFRGGRGGGGIGGGRFGSQRDRRPFDDDDNSSRGTKRSFDEHAPDASSPRDAPRYDRQHERGSRDFGRGGRGDRGGRGFRGRGGFRGGRGSFRGGRGYGRGRY